MRVIVCSLAMLVASTAMAQSPYGTYGGYGTYARPTYSGRHSTYGYGWRAPRQPDPVRRGMGWHYYSNPWNSSREMEAYNRWFEPFERFNKTFENQPPQRLYIHGQR